MSERMVAAALLVLVMLIWGSTFVITKAALVEIPPLFLALLRFIVASLLLVPVALLRHGMTLPRPVSWGPLLFMGFTGVLLYYVGFNFALYYTTASQAALVQSCVPIGTALAAAWWLKERLTGPRMLGVALAVVGVVLIFARAADPADARNPALGNLMLAGTVVAWAGYTVAAKRCSHVDSLLLTAWLSLVGTAMLAPPALIEIGLRGLGPISAQAWIATVYLGALASAVCYLIYNYALRVLDAGQVGTFVNLVPLVGVFSGVMFLDESLHPAAIGGGVLILAGVWLSSRSAGPVTVARDSV